jgi:hypothetical protein
MLFRRSKDVQGRDVGCIAAGLDIEFFPKPANILRLVVNNRSIPLKKSRLPVCTVSA